MLKLGSHHQQHEPGDALQSEETQLITCNLHNQSEWNALYGRGSKPLCVQQHDMSFEQDTHIFTKSPSLSSVVSSLSGEQCPTMLHTETSLSLSSKPPSCQAPICTDLIEGSAGPAVGG